MRSPNDGELYRRGMQTLVACWEAYARGSRGAELVRYPGLVAAVFPTEPEWQVYNNALLERDLARAARAEALAAMEAGYAEAVVPTFAVWVHESDEPARAELEARGYAVDTSTRAMEMVMTEAGVPRPGIEPAPSTWAEHCEGGPATSGGSSSSCRSDRRPLI